MAGTTVDIDQMSEAIMKQMQDYADVATEDMKKAVKEVAKDCKAEIARTAPKNTGAYAKSWTYATTEQGANNLHVTVYSAKKYYLTHLLENGHVKRGGGRTRAFPHIAPAEEKAKQELEEKIVELLGG